MDVLIERTKEKLSFKFEGTGDDLLQKLKINREEVIMTRNNELITLDEELDNTDKIKILSVISGG